MRTNIRVTLTSEDAILYGRALWPMLILAVFKLVVLRRVTLADVNDPEYRVESSAPWMIVPASAIETVTKDQKNGTA